MKLSLSTWDRDEMPGALTAKLGKQLTPSIHLLLLRLGDELEIELWPADSKRIRSLSKDLLLIAEALEGVECP